MTEPTSSAVRQAGTRPSGAAPRLTLGSTGAGLLDLHRFGSLYLLSALLVLAGGYATLYSDGKPVSVALHRVLGTQLAYAAVVLMVLAFLHRARGETRDPLLLTGVLSVFLLDALLVQHLYGWTSSDGCVAAAVGASVSVVLVLGLAIALRLPLLTRPIVSMIAAILFSRLGPFLLSGAAVEELSPRHVALGFLLAACLLPGILLPALRAPDGLPSRALDLGGTLLPLAAALVHFLPAGASFDLPLRITYFAPAVILAPLFLERVVPNLERLPGLTRLNGLLPYLGLALSATRLPPGMLDAPWAQSWPLTPFTLCLALTVLVQSVRAIRNRDMGLAHVVVGLVAAGTLGGDLPAILASACYPTPVQFATVASLAWLFIAVTRRIVPGTALHGLVAFVAAGSLVSLGIPWPLAWITLVAWGPLLISALTFGARPLADRLRGGLATAAMLPSVLLLLFGQDSLLRLAFAASCCAVGGLMAALTRDRLLAQVSLAATALGVFGWPVAVQVHGEVGLGMLLMEAGVGVLLLAFVHSLMRERLQAALERWAARRE